MYTFWSTSYTKLFAPLNYKINNEKYLINVYNCQPLDTQKFHNELIKILWKKIKKLQLYIILLECFAVMV